MKIIKELFNAFIRFICNLIDKYFKPKSKKDKIVLIWKRFKAKVKKANPMNIRKSGRVKHKKANANPI